MESDRWRRIEEIYHSALSVAVDERPRFLQRVCSGDDELRGEVESLLAYESAAEDFIKEPALQAAARLLAPEETAPGEPDLIGRTVSHYRVLEKLGGGGMGVVYKAEDTRLGRTVALKFLPEELSHDRQAVARFQREAHAASTLNHPHICTIHDIEEYEGRQFIVMELLQGQTLKHLIGGKPLAWQRVAELGAHIADALHSAHLHGVIHRDIKPANIFVTERGEAKVLDFGVAKLIRPVSETAATEDATQTQMAIGTLPYMAPEQLRGHLVDTRIDLYALGAVLYEMATGHRPFEAALPAELAADIIHKPPQPPNELNRDLPAELQGIILKCLEKEPANRHQSAKELLVDLQRFGSAATVIRARRVSAKALAFASVALAILIIGVLAYINKAGGRISLASRPQITSLAVLPLSNLTGDPNQEYFADGMTEELITDLAKISALKVISRTSVMRFKNTKTSLPQIARELGVDGIVEGSVQRSGGRVRISAQLIRAATDTHLWGNSYERDGEDVLKLESEVASAVADQIRITISPEERARLGSSRRVDPKAYDAYLKGRNYSYSALSQDTVLQGIELLQHSLALDNTYAPAHAALSFSYQFLAFNGYEAPATAMPKARSAALDALRLDDMLGEAHASLFLVKYLYDLDWAGAEAELKRALELDPNSPIPHQRRAEYLTCNLQQFDEAYRELRRALELDPNSVFIAQELAWNRQMARHWDEAVRDLHKAVALDPSNAPVHGFLAVSLAHLNRRADALAEVEKRLALMPAGRDFAFDYNLIEVYASLEMRQSALTILQHWLEKGASAPYIDAYIVAEAYGVLGEKELTLQWLDKAYTNRSPQIVFIKIDWALDGIRSDSRFKDLLRRMKLPQ